jgi:hypothetical protein
MAGTQAGTPTPKPAIQADFPDFQLVKKNLRIFEIRMQDANQLYFWRCSRVCCSMCAPYGWT